MIRLAGWLLKLVAWLLALSMLWVAIYRWVDPPATFIMLRDRANGLAVDQHWVPLSAMAADLPRAVIGAEDSNFCSHHGFDIEAIEQAMKANEDGGRLRGGSTISQQVAKNVFLWPGRTMVRKGLEAWFTLLIELLWDKQRIMEVYLNIAEMGEGIYGAEAAALQYFRKSASQLSRQEAARLAAILPQPVKRSAASPGRWTQRYANRIASRARVVANEGLDHCLSRG